MKKRKKIGKIKSSKKKNEPTDAQVKAMNKRVAKYIDNWENDVAELHRQLIGDDDY